MEALPSQRCDIHQDLSAKGEHIKEIQSKSTKVWFQFWGPLGNPAIEAVDAAAEAQQNYLRKLKETLEEVEILTSTSR
jgi:hypothetical protein